MARPWLGIIWGLNVLLQRPTVVKLYYEHMPLGVLREDGYEHLQVTQVGVIDATEDTKSRERFRTHGPISPPLEFLLRKSFK